MSATNKPLGFLRRWLLHQRNKRFLRKWAARRDGDSTGKYYIRRHYDLNFSFFDLYWYVKTIEGRQRVYTHYLRVHEEQLMDAVRDVEEHELPSLIVKIHEGKGEEYF